MNDKNSKEHKENVIKISNILSDTINKELNVFNIYEILNAIETVHTMLIKYFIQTSLSHKLEDKKKIMDFVYKTLEEQVKNKIQLLKLTIDEIN